MYRRASRRTLYRCAVHHTRFARLSPSAYCPHNGLAGKNVHVESENPRALPASIFLYLRYSESALMRLALDRPSVMRIYASYLKNENRILLIHCIIKTKTLRIGHRIGKYSLAIFLLNSKGENGRLISIPQTFEIIKNKSDGTTMEPSDEIARE